MQKWVCLGLALGLALGCARRGDDDDDNTTAPPIFGAFEITGANLAASEFEFPVGIYSLWIRFEDDNTFYVMDETPLGFRNVNAGVFSATEDQVNLDGTLMNYSVDGDDIALSHPDFTIDVARNPATPEVVDWAGIITVDAGVQTVRATQRSDLAWDGTYFWYGHYETNEIIQYDFISASEISALTTTNFPIGVGYDGANVWTSSNGFDGIYQVDMTTGNNLMTSASMGPWVYGIAWDGTHLWAYANNSREIYQYDPVANMVLNTIDVSELQFGSLQGMEYVDGDLYIMGTNAVYRCQTSPFQVLQTFLIDDLSFSFASGIGHNGTAFYGFRYDFEVQEGYIARLLFSQ